MSFIDDDLAVRIRTKLIELQGEQTDAAFAPSLGCTREHWWNVKNGKRRPSYELIKRATRRYPVLLSIVMRDLTDEPVEPAVPA